METETELACGASVVGVSTWVLLDFFLGFLVLVSIAGGGDAVCVMISHSSQTSADRPTFSTTSATALFFVSLVVTSLSLSLSLSLELSLEEETAAH